MESIQLRPDQNKDEHGMSSKTKIHIFVNRRKLEVDQAELTGEQLLRGREKIPQSI